MSTPHADPVRPDPAEFAPPADQLELALLQNTTLPAAFTPVTLQELFQNQFR